MSKLDYTLHTEPVCSGFDGETCWVHARGGIIPGDKPRVVVTLQKLLLEASDVFYALNQVETDDLGATWSSPIEQNGLGRREEGGGIVSCICDFTPQWHAASSKLLGTGQVVYYVNNRVMPEPRPRGIAYSVLDAASNTWAPWRTIETPTEERFFSVGAGSTQRYDLPDGRILLPIYLHSRGNLQNAAAVMRCSFDGEELIYEELGNELVAPAARGSCEPSMTRFGNRYYMTIRDDDGSWVSASNDGLHYEAMIPWQFDDGQELGNYNTQTHWVTHSGGLFLLYTRRGANNDHVFRHRAPLFIGQVDPERLCVIRDTERIAIPERGARLGNFGVCNISPQETWIFDAEWMQPLGCERYGSDNTVWLARIVWRQPNALMDASGNAQA